MVMLNATALVVLPLQAELTTKYMVMRPLQGTPPPPPPAGTRDHTQGARVYGQHAGEHRSREQAHKVPQKQGPNTKKGYARSPQLRGSSAQMDHVHQKHTLQATRTESAANKRARAADRGRFHDV
jgi:hypothetical protein